MHIGCAMPMVFELRWCLYGVQRGTTVGTTFFVDGCFSSFWFG